MPAPGQAANLVVVEIKKHTENMRALVANEPRSYREVLADTLQQLRPQVEVSTVDPDVLDAEVERIDPHLVVCSQNRGPIRDKDLAWECWVNLYPGGENLAEITTVGGRAMLVGISFGDFLSVVDGTEFLRCERTLEGAVQKAGRKTS
jgi:hypothetical protein